MTPRSAARSRALFLVGFGCWIVAPSGAQSRFQPMVGEDIEIVVRPGDTQYSLARKYDMSMSDLVRANGMKAKRPKPGDTLVIPTRRILPYAPANGVVLNIPERRVYLFRDGKVAQTHAVAVGKADWQTDIGRYEIVRKTKNPTWYPPASMVEREGAKDEPVPPGPENPLGDRWIGWSAKGIGFHSTNSPRSIGGVVSHGCVRLYPEKAQALFDAVSVGLPIYSVYETVLIARDGGSYYLSVWPDVYGRGGASQEDVEKKLAEAGLLGGVDPDALAKIVKGARGLPRRIIGSDLKLEVNGTLVDSPIAPTNIGGRLVVAARATVDALGGVLTSEPDGAVKIASATKTLRLTAGKPEADLDGETISLPVSPSVVVDTLVMPLRTLLDHFGAEMRREGDILRITSPVSR